MSPDTSVHGQCLELSVPLGPVVMAEFDFGGGHGGQDVGHADLDDGVFVNFEIIAEVWVEGMLNALVEEWWEVNVEWVDPIVGDGYDVQATKKESTDVESILRVDQANLLVEMCAGAILDDDECLAFNRAVDCPGMREESFDEPGVRLVDVDSKEVVVFLSDVSARSEVVGVEPASSTCKVELSEVSGHAV